MESAASNGDPGKPSSTRAASDAVPSPPLDAMAGLSEEVAQPEQEQMHLYLHDDFPVQDLEGDFDSLGQDLDRLLTSSDPQQPPGHINMLIVLNARKRLSVLLDVSNRFLPVPQFIIPARKSLQAILECCNNSIILGFLSRVVYAPSILQAVHTMREAIAAVDNLLLFADEEALNLFTSIHKEVDALEKQCLQAIAPPPQAAQAPDQAAPAPFQAAQVPDQAAPAPQEEVALPAPSP